MTVFETYFPSGFQYDGHEVKTYDHVVYIVKLCLKNHLSTEQKNGGFTYISLFCINHTDNFKKNVAHKLDYYVGTSTHTFNIKTAALWEMLTLQHFSPGCRGGKPYSHRILTAETD